MSVFAIEHKQADMEQIHGREAVSDFSGGCRFIRRMQDIILSLTALVLLSPFMLLVALAIVIDSPGDGPIFAQTRIGRDGVPFTMYKFRSMCPNADQMLEQLLDKNEMQPPVFKMRDDPRITRVGKFIRRAGMDELPQLWNVLRGEMSLVGPRPALPREVAQYDERARRRLAITPGLSCYWQICPDRNLLTFDEWVDLDLKYIQERSLFTDWKIIFRTFGAVIRMNGQ